MFIVKFPVIVVVVYVATGLVNRDDYIMCILLYKVPFTHDRLDRCFRFVYVYACIAVFLCCCRFWVNRDLYNQYL